MMAALGSRSRPRPTRTSRTPRGVDLFPDASLFPLPEIQIDRTPVGQIMRQQTPRTPTAQYIEDPIHDFSPLYFLRSSSRLGCGNQGFHDCPFFICYI